MGVYLLENRPVIAMISNFRLYRLFVFISSPTEIFTRKNLESETASTLCLSQELETQSHGQSSVHEWVEEGVGIKREVKIARPEYMCVLFKKIVFSIFI